MNKAAGAQRNSAPGAKSPRAARAPKAPRALRTPKAPPAASAPGRPEQAAGPDRVGAAPAPRSPNRPWSPTGSPPAASPAPEPSIAPQPSGYAPDGTSGRAAALPLSTVQLLDSPFRQNQARNTTYLLFLDPERMLRSFRLNYGLPFDGGAARRLGGTGLADPRPHDRPPAVRPRADLRQHQRRGRQNPRPLPGQPAGRAPGPGHHGRVPPRLPVRLPRGLLRLAGGRESRSGRRTT